MTKVEEDQLRRIEELVRRIDQLPDQHARETAGELMQAILAFHGAGIERMMEMISESPQACEVLFRRFANDTLVANLLVLHGLHPDDLETRVRQILAKQPTHTELIGVFEGVVRVRVASGGHTNGGVKQSLEALLRDAIPDAAEIVVEESVHHNGFVPLSALDGFPNGTLTAKG